MMMFLKVRHATALSFVASSFRSTTPLAISTVLRRGEGRGEFNPKSQQLNLFQLPLPIIRPSFATSKALFSTRGGRSDDDATVTTTVPRTALAEIDEKTGEFKRTESVWRNVISNEEGSKFPPESGRYHLFVAYACPWAHRTLMVRALKGLEDVISVTVVHPIFQKTRPDDPNDSHVGWIFGSKNSDAESLVNTQGLGGPFPASYPGNEPDPIINAASIRDLYQYAGDTNGKYTVPILWDKQENTIVNNESAEILRILSSQFNDFAKHPELDLYPDDDENLRADIDAVNDWVYSSLNNGVYKCGFAKTQTAYNAAIEELTAAFDRAASILETQRYIAGDTFTEADVRLFVTLLRFDEVYNVYFKTNTRSVATTPSILNYCREIYQMEGVADTCNMEQVKTHYYCSHPDLNKWSIVPRGCGFEELLKQPHDRNAL